MTIEGIRSIDRLTIDFGSSGGPGWHVVIGPNGSGKSTIVRALALAMLGDRDIDASRVPLETWLRAGGERGRIDIKIEFPKIESRRNRGRGAATGPDALRWETHLTSDPGGGVTSRKASDASAEELPWNRDGGFFSAAFGTFRRLSGGDKEYEALFNRRPRLGAHLSALNDGAALVEAERWLQEMHLEELEAERDLRNDFEAAFADLLISFFLERRAAPDARRPRQLPGRSIITVLEDVLGRIERRINARMRLGAVKAIRLKAFDPRDAEISEDRVLAETDLEIDGLSKRIVRFLNASGFLFDRLQIVEIRKDRITLRTEDGTILGLDQLSDGYRSVMGLGFEILRLMLVAYKLDDFQRSLNETKGVIDLPGIVAIDEIEAHLHPPWQEAVGDWLRRCFPRIQFIVTTHSPIVCRSIATAGRLRGSVWLLPSPGGEAGVQRITGTRLDRLVYGDILEAVGTEAFGRDVEHSEAAAAKLERLAILNRKDVKGLLDGAQRAELETLRRMFPTQPNPTVT